MVKIVDGFREKMEALDRHNSLAELAKRSFKGSVNYTDYMGHTPIVVREDITGCDVRIDPTGFIEVNKQSYFESAKKFAEEAEKLMGIEFTLTTTYEL